MTCIHGIDEINCPICRLSRSTVPLNHINKIDLNKNNFVLKNPIFEKNRAHSETYHKDLVANKIPAPSLITQIPRPNLLGEIPDFTNWLFNKRIHELNLEKSNPKTEIQLDNHNLINNED